MAADNESASISGDVDTLRLLADAPDEAIVIHDYECILAANRGFIRLFRFHETEIVGIPFFHFMKVQDPDILLSMAQANQPTFSEAEGIRRDGTLFPAEISGRTIEYKGRPARIVRIRDLTRRRLAETSLRESEERFRATFEQAAVGMAHVATDGTWLRVNRRLCEMVGYSREELLARTFLDITHPDDLAVDLDQMNEVLAGRLECYTMEKRYFRKDGSILWINLTVSLVRPSDGLPHYFISIIEDISVRKAIEETLRQSQKMEVVGQLTSSIAHDFGNFLNVIKGNLQLLQRHLTENVPIEYLGSAMAGAELAEKLIRQLLSFSRRQDVELETINVQDLISDVKGLIQSTLSHHVKLIVEHEEVMCRIVCDRTQFETALFNLILNARDAIFPSNGTIIVKTSIERVAWRADRRSGHYVRIDVRDTGHGMSKDTADRACEPFFSTKPLGSGTGLGLSQVARCAEQMSGFLELSSVVGVGTTVSLFAPSAA